MKTLVVALFLIGSGSAIDGEWRITDVEYESGSLAALLAQGP